MVNRLTTEKIDMVSDFFKNNMKKKNISLHVIPVLLNLQLVKVKTFKENTKCASNFATPIQNTSPTPSS